MKSRFRFLSALCTFHDRPCRAGATVGVFVGGGAGARKRVDVSIRIRDRNDRRDASRNRMTRPDGTRSIGRHKRQGPRDVFQRIRKPNPVSHHGLGALLRLDRRRRRIASRIGSGFWRRERSHLFGFDRCVKYREGLVGLPLNCWARRGTASPHTGIRRRHDDGGQIVAGDCSRTTMRMASPGSRWLKQRRGQTALRLGWAVV